MLKALRHRPLIVGMVEVLVDAARYVAIVLLEFCCCGSSRRSRSEAGRISSSNPHGGS